MDRSNSNFDHEKPPSTSSTIRNSSLEDGSKDGFGVLIVDWDSPDDAENPFNWPKRRKWTLTIMVCIMVVLINLPAGSYSAGNRGMEEVFGLSQTNFPWLYFATTSRQVASGILPLIFAPMTEHRGRKLGYFIPWVMFVLALIPCAAAQNFQTIIIARFFEGGCSGMGSVIAGGTLADIWRDERERSLPTALLTVASTIGIALGPFVGGMIASVESWRWIFITQIIVNVAMTPLLYLCLAETRAVAILKSRASSLRKDSSRPYYTKAELGDDSVLNMIKTCLVRIGRMLFSECIVISLTLWMSFTWGVLFIFMQSIPQNYADVYSFSPRSTAFVETALSVGMVIGTLVAPFFIHFYLRSGKRNGQGRGSPVPEARLYISIPGTLLFTTGILWYGWTMHPSLHPMLPTAGLVLIGFGVFAVYFSVSTFLIDAYEKYAASALAAATFGRGIFSAFLPLSSQAIFLKLGIKWASTLLGGVALLLSAVPVLLVWKGNEVRRRSPFMREAHFNGHEKGEDK